MKVYGLRLRIASMSQPDYTGLMETVVTIPDEVFRKAEELATALGLSRSEVYSAALTEFIRERREQRITEGLDEVYAQEGSTLDPALRMLQAASVPVERW